MNEKWYGKKVIERRGEEAGKEDEEKKTRVYIGYNESRSDKSYE